MKKIEEAETRGYAIIKVARDVDLVQQIGKDIYFDLVDHDKVWSFRVQKRMPFNIVKEEVAKEFSIPERFQRLWLWAQRQNHTYRPSRPLTHLEETNTVGQLREVSNKLHNAELKLFLEVDFGLDLRPIPPPDKTKDDILLFFKLYDPEIAELRYVGRLFVKTTAKPTEILTKLNEMAGYAPDEVIDLYEEIKFEPHVMCEPIDKTFTFQINLLEDGDIVCFQKSLPIESRDQFRYPDVPSFLEYLHDLQELKVAFHHATKDDVSIHTIRLPKQGTVGDVINALKAKVELSHPSAELRLLEVFYHKIYKIFPAGQQIENINDKYWTIHAEEIPEEEKNLGPRDGLINVYHFTKETARNHTQILNFGEPFFLVIHEDETLADIKERIQRKLQVPDEEFSKWRFVFVSLGRPEYLQDSDIVSRWFQRRDVYGVWEQYLGLEHSENAPKRPRIANQAATIATSPQPISDADIEATYSQAKEIARSITSASSSSISLSSLDEATKQEVLHFFNLIEMPFEELASSRSTELVACITKIQTISAIFFTKYQQQHVNEMANQIQARVAQVQYYQDEIKAKDDYIASIRGISSSILTNNEKDAKLKQEEEELAIGELEQREKLERVIKHRLAVRLEREKLYAETKDLLTGGENGGTKIQAATDDLWKAQLKLRSLSDDWDFFGAHFARP